MLKRKMTDTLLEWSRTRNRECLLVKGARQIGKTYIIREFGKKYYKNFIELNFLKNPEHKEIFEGSLSAEEIYKRLTVQVGNAELIPDKTLIFLDEIQECGAARTALKFLAEDNRYDCIASGSMLGVAYKQTASVPVGYERQIEMFALDLEEFLWAIKMSEDAIDNVREYFYSKQQIPKAINDAMMKNLREYMIVGGMPAVVNKYIETSNFNEVHSEQTKIIMSYLDDIAKYASTAEKPKVRNCYLSIPRQLAKENKKFQYSVVEKGGTARKYDNSLEWMRDAGYIKYCVNVSRPEFPLPAYEEPNYFKAYATDIGMLTAMYGYEMKAAVYNNTLKGPAKGGLYENLIADILMKKKLPLNYYKPSENRQEIEFLYTEGGAIIPVEVKAGNNAAVSLDEFIETFEPPYGLKLINGNSGINGRKVSMPLYMAMFL